MRGTRFHPSFSDPYRTDPSVGAGCAIAVTETQSQECPKETQVISDVSRTTETAKNSLARPSEYSMGVFCLCLAIIGGIWSVGFGRGEPAAFWVCIESGLLACYSESLFSARSDKRKIERSSRNEKSPKSVTRYL